MPRGISLHAKRMTRTWPSIAKRAERTFWLRRRWGSWLLIPLKKRAMLPASPGTMTSDVSSAAVCMRPMISSLWSATRFFAKSTWPTYLEYVRTCERVSVRACVRKGQGASESAVADESERTHSQRMVRLRIGSSATTMKPLPPLCFTRRGVDSPRADICL